MKIETSKALAKFLYEKVPFFILRELITQLLPTLTEAQADHLLLNRLPLIAEGTLSDKENE